MRRHPWSAAPGQYATRSDTARERWRRIFCCAALALLFALLARFAQAAELTPEQLAKEIEPPYELGDKIPDLPAWTIVDRAGVVSGYAFETGDLAPLPGFSGAPINVLVVLDIDGQFLDAKIVSQSEPVFVSGLGVAPFHEFVRQYRGLSIFDSITVGVPYGASGRGSSAQVYLDGVVKATASVRIAHQSILAASLEIARAQFQHVSSGPAPEPDPEYVEDLVWDDLIEKGVAHRLVVKNADVQDAFKGTLWAYDDPEAADDPDGVFLDLWLVDIGPESAARAVLGRKGLEQLASLRSISPEDEPILLLANGRQGLVPEDFVRNTSPDTLFAHQDGLPMALRDADLDVDLAAGAPDFEHRMVLRIDRRLGFDPTRDWTLTLRTERRHGAFMPQIGSHDLTLKQHAPERFFRRLGEAPPDRPIWQEALLARLPDMIALGVGLAALFGVMAFALRPFARSKLLTPMRLSFLVAMTAFVGWYGQGQLSIVTVIGALRTAIDGQSFAFLLYDPFSLAIWAVTIFSLFLWGRGFFCGWLCPFGALQEFAHHVGKRLGLKQFEPSLRWDRRLRAVKYAVLAVLIGAAISYPVLNDALAEVEPFKTTITVSFDRSWPYVLYAGFWLVLGLFVFKGFCRFVCPLGAALALGGRSRLLNWIPRRPECGSPCRLCEVRCKYGSIEPSGAVRYDECFQCLDCVAIHDDAKTCVPLVLAAKGRSANGVAKREGARP